MIFSFISISFNSASVFGLGRIESSLSESFGKAELSTISPTNLSLFWFLPSFLQYSSIGIYLTRYSSSLISSFCLLLEEFFFTISDFALLSPTPRVFCYASEINMLSLFVSFLSGESVSNDIVDCVLLRVLPNFFIGTLPFMELERSFSTFIAKFF